MMNDIAALSISEIQARLKETVPDDALIAALEADSRVGVRKLAEKIHRARARHHRELARLDALLAIEREIRASGKTVVCGVDEAGRGPLAGPVVAAAVILSPDFMVEGIDDSKKLLEHRREELFERITEAAEDWGVGIVSHDEIDETNILEAAMRAMRDAVAGLKTKPDIVLVDGNRAPGSPCEERVIVDGDARCLSIAAASIVAKVVRDRMMRDLDTVFPEYGFARHKGYGAPVHIDAIRRHGPCDIHRISFKIVPDVAPAGTVAKVMRKRIENASDRASFDRVVATITRLKEHFHRQDIRELRDVYIARREAFRAQSKIRGDRGEETACNFLKNNGYSVLDRNWRAPECGYEIDLIARDGDTVVFCEVKTAGSRQFGHSATWVTPEKVARLSRAAGEFCAGHNLAAGSYRFDVLALTDKGGAFTVDHIVNAFDVPEEQ